MIKYLKSKWTSVLVGLFVLVFGANTAMAASLSNVVLAPDSNQTGVITNHAISFRTSSTGAISGAGVIEVTYPSGFNLSQTSLGFYDGALGSAWFSRSGNTIYINMGSAASLGNSESTFFQIQNVINTSTAGSYNVSVTTKNSAGAIVDGPTNSASFNIGQVQTLDHFAVTPSTTNTTVGQNVTLTITAQDVNNSTVTNYSGTPILSGLATSPNSTVPYYGPVSFANGVASVTVRSYSAQSGQSVTAADSGKTGNSGTITFSPSALASIRIEPSQSIQTITAGTNIQFTAVGSDAYGNVRSGDAFTWTGTTSTGLFNTRIVGNYTVFASSAGINSNQVAVGVTHAVAATVVISPAGPLTMTADQSQAFSVNATDAYSNVWNATSSAVYNENDPAGSFTGNTYNAGRVGSWTLYATVDGINSGNVTANVAHGVATGITVTPDPRTVNSGTTVTYTSTAFDADANTWDVTSTTNFSISAGAGGSWNSNVYTSANVGVWTVTGTNGSLNDTATLTVNPLPGVLHHIQIEPSVSSQIITAGQTILFTATGYDAYNNVLTGYSFVWHNTTSTGLFNSTSAGVYEVYASIGLINSNRISVRVNPASAASIWVLPIWNEAIPVGSSTEIWAVVFDAYGNAVADGTQVTWSRGNSNFTLSSITSTTVNGIAVIMLTAPNQINQSTTVTAAANGIASTSGTITTGPASALTVIDIFPYYDQTITAGSTMQFYATGYDQYGNIMNGLTFNWYNTSNNGLFNNSAPGKYLVYASVGGVKSHEVWVNVIAKDEPKKDEPAKKDESGDKKEETTSGKAAKSLTGATAAKASETKEEQKKTEEAKETGQAVEMTTKTSPLIEAQSTEKPTRNWWIPIIIIVLVLAAAYYGYVALAGRDNKGIDATSAEKGEATKKVSKTAKTDISGTKEIKPIDEKKDDKTRW